MLAFSEPSAAAHYVGKINNQRTTVPGEVGSFL